MRVLISNDNPLAHFYIRQGIARVFTQMGHDAIIWDIHKKPVFDAFDEFQPDFFIGQTYNITPELMTCIADRPDMKVVMKASDWGNVSDGLDREKYPVLIASQNEIDNVMTLKTRTNKPDLVYIHYDNDAILKTHNHWEENDIDIHSFMNAADVFAFCNGKPKPEYECDIGFVGGRWGYKSQTLDKWFLPLCGPKEDFDIKVFGNQPWGISQYCGYLPDDEVRHFLASAKICPNLSEPHSKDLGYDVIERPFKLLSNKCFVISDQVRDLAKHIPNGIVYAANPEEFRKEIEFFLNNPAAKDEVVEIGYKEVMENHTYFHRVTNLLMALDMYKESDECLEAYKEVKEGLGCKF